jgi:hypothetical protein
MLAALRPDAWDLPLLVHVAGAMLLVGALVVVAVAMAGALRGGVGTMVLTRLTLRTLLLGALPGYVLMRAGAAWIASKEDVPDDATWVGIGFSTADGGLLLVIIATVLAWRATRRGAAGPGAAGRATAALAVVLVLAYAVTIWAMTTKPG